MKSQQKVIYLSAAEPKWGLKSGPVILRILRFLNTKFEVYNCSFSSDDPSAGLRHYKMQYRRWWWPPSTLGFHTRLRANKIISELRLTDADRTLVVYPFHIDLAQQIYQICATHYDVIVHDLHETELTKESIQQSLRQAASIFCVSERLVEIMREFNERSFLLPPAPGDDLGLSPPFAENKPVALVGGFNSDYIDILTNLNLPILAIGPQIDGYKDKSVSFIDRFEKNDDAVRFVSEQCSAVAVVVPLNTGDYASHSFPSKLLDFCRSGLPIIIIAPSTSSVGIWAKRRNWSLYIENENHIKAFNHASEMLRDAETWTSCRNEVIELRVNEFNGDVINEFMLSCMQDTRPRAKSRNAELQ